MDRIKTIKTKLLARVGEAAEAGDIDQVALLSAQVSTIRNLEAEWERIENQVIELEASLNGKSSTDAPLNDECPSRFLAETVSDIAPRNSASRLRIEMDWPSNGKTLGREVIQESTAAATLAVLLSRLVTLYGKTALDAAANMRVSRGPLVTNDPARHFQKPDGALYAHKRIPGTSHYVLTNNSTDEKVELIKALFKAVGIAPFSFTVRKVS